MVSQIEAFSVLMSVYGKDSPSDLQEALDSIVCQTLPPTETVIVLDGPVGEDILSVLAGFRGVLNIKAVHLHENVGLALALREGVQHCSYDLVARMDSDDICLPDRFERQLKVFQEDPTVDVVGGLISEFDDNDPEYRAIRLVPEEHSQILRRAKVLSPVNHVTVMYRKNAVLSAGNYQNFRGIEDYPLWVAMLNQGCRFYNIQAILVNVRAGVGLSSRRGGVKYAITECRALLYMYRLGFFSLPLFLFNVVVRTSVRLLGHHVRVCVYQLLRNKPSSSKFSSDK